MSQELLTFLDIASEAACDAGAILQNKFGNLDKIENKGRPGDLVTESDMSMAKLKATEALAMIADEAIQIHGGMGLMDELPLERIWRDARVERIWEGTSEIQRHIISREMLRPHGG